MPVRLFQKKKVRRPLAVTDSIKAAASHTFVVKRSDRDVTPALALVPFVSALPDRALRDHRRAIL